MGAAAADPGTDSATHHHNRQEIQARGRLAVWWRAVRPFTLTASFTPVFVGFAVAFHDGGRRFDIFLVTLLAAVAIQAATNLINEYYDGIRGVDDTASVGPSGVIVYGLLSPRAVLAGGIALLALASLLGVWLVAVSGWPILVLGILSILAAYAYTGGPLPLGYHGLGDLTVFVFMGPVIVVGAYYVQIQAVSSAAAWASLPIAALVTAILVVNNLRDIEDDRRKGKRTLAVFIGARGTRLEYVLLVAGAYAAVAAGAAVRALPPATLTAFLTLPLAVRVCRGIYADVGNGPLTHDLRETANLHQWVGFLLAAGFLLSSG
jgi:1,4-dihydroxy-2-naphthoate octaprenyltransferase